jgi:hypothetical protein
MLAVEEKGKKKAVAHRAAEAPATAQTKDTVDHTGNTFGVNVGTGRVFPGANGACFM